MLFCRGGVRVCVWVDEIKLRRGIHMKLLIILIAIALTIITIIFILKRKHIASSVVTSIFALFAFLVGFGLIPLPSANTLEESSTPPPSEISPLVQNSVDIFGNPEVNT
jgi:hypothetical protein